MIRKEKLHGFFIDEETGDHYRRVQGGLAWPTGDRSGCLVVVGEELDEDRALGARHLKILAEREARFMSDISRFYLELANTFSAGPWVGDPSNRPFLELCKRENPRFALTEALYFNDSQNLEYYFQLIKELTQAEKKILHSEGHAMIMGYLMALPIDGLKRPANEHPPAAALGYVLSHLWYNSPDEQMTVSDIQALNKRHGRR